VADADAPLFTTRYEHLISLYRAEILAGRLKPGDTLPSAREISEQHGVSIPTAQKVAPALATQGLVSVSAGKRAVVISPPAKPGEALKTAARRVVDIWNSGSQRGLGAAIRELDQALGEDH
jgi:GntR family transcriptional regulator